MSRSAALPPDTHRQGRVYTDLTVISGQRTLKPTHLASDRLIFASPPHLEPGRIEIILTERADERRWAATVLPHEPTAVRIPIALDSGAQPA